MLCKEVLKIQRSLMFRGVGVADIIKVLALVEIAPVRVRVPAEPATEMLYGMTPRTEGDPIIRQDRSGRPSNQL